MNCIIPRLSAAAALLSVSFACAATTPQARITLVDRSAALGESSNASASQSNIVRKHVEGLPDREAYRFSQPVHLGSPVTEVLEIVFHSPTTLKNIEASNDFHVASTSCSMGRTYNEGESCAISVTLDPHGPGNRAGKLSFTSNESVTPDVVGLQGQTLGAVMSFIPSQINTVPQTRPGGQPLMFNPWDVVTDQGDNLYLLDDLSSSQPQSSGVVYFMDSSNVLTTLVGGGTEKVSAAGTPIPNSQVFLDAPTGIAVDSFLDLYTTEFFAGLDETSRGRTRSIAGLGTIPAQNCGPASNCPILKTQFDGPIWVNVDSSQNLFVVDSQGYYTIPWVNGPEELTVLDSGLLATDSTFGLDSTDDLYALDSALDNNPEFCAIDGIAPSSGFQWDAAGSGICGFAANNVRSQNAKIQNYISGYAFDAAGDMYFSDAKNNVIRRVDAYNGLIRTVAGNGALPAGWSGDGLAATDATLDGPTGVAADSMGSVYTIQTDPSVLSGAYGFARKVGPVGFRTYPITIVGQTSPVETVLITNTGNDNLQVSNVILGGADPLDFVADPATSSCVWSQPLVSGRSCQIGYSCKPKAAGARSATITFVDNTATFQNQVILSCFALAAKVTASTLITSPGNQSKYIAGSNVPLQMTISNTLTTPITPPTGTVNMTITGPSPATFSGVVLTPVGGAPKSMSAVSTMVDPALGEYSVAGTYSGDSLDNPGIAPAITFFILQVTPAVTITVPANNSKVLPGNVGATVNVSNAGLTPTAPSPTGTLTLKLTNTATSAVTTFTATMPAGSAGLTTTNIPLGNLALGKYTLVASYGGDTADKAASSTTTTFTVVQITPTVTITSPQPLSYSFLTGLTYSASVSNAGLTPADPGAPTGTVTFTVNDLTANTKTTYGPFVLGAGVAGVANVSVPLTYTPTVASYSISATYNGDTDDTAATSNTSLFNVDPVTPVISWATPAAVQQGTSLSGTQLNALAFYNGNVVPGTYVYNPPAGTFMETPGENTLQVTFHPSDSTDYNQATGSVQLEVTQQIRAKPTSTRLASATNPAKSGSPVELNIVVQPETGATAPTGAITILENGKILGTASLAAGKATVKLTTLSVGTHNLVAQYGGDAKSKASASAPVKQVVSPGQVLPGLQM